MGEFVPPVLKLSGRVHNAIAIEADAPFDFEQAGAYDASYGAVSGVNIINIPVHDAQRLAAAGAQNVDLPVRGTWAQVDQQTGRLEHTMRLM